MHVHVDVAAFEGKLSERGAVEPQRARWEVASDQLLHPGHRSLPDLEVFLGDSVLPGCPPDGDVQGPEVGGRGRGQRPQLVLLLLFLMQNSPLNNRSRILRGEKFQSSNRDVLLVSLLLDVLVCSLDVLDVHRTQLA